MKSKPNKNNKHLKPVMKFFLKLIISAVALFFVYRKINIEDLKYVSENVKPVYFLLGVLAFNFSKWISIFRIRDFIQPLGIQIPHLYNWKLYYIGAFYNLFLPGSIGGDGYKVYLLHKRYHQPVKSLLPVVLLDRISGLVALLFISAIMWVFVDSEKLSYNEVSGITTAIIIYPLYYFMLYIFFKKYKSAFLSTNIYSIASQFFQIITAWCILEGLGVEQNVWNYLVLFMLASIASIVPVTPGGLGAREFVSALGYTYMNVEKDTAILLSTLFFLVTAISSLTGLVFYYTNMEKSNSQNQ